MKSIKEMTDSELSKALDRLHFAHAMCKKSERSKVEEQMHAFHVECFERGILGVKKPKGRK